jgi:CheY-like chemotaxis protein
MVATVTEQKTTIRSPAAPWSGVPERLKVLYITTPHRTGAWLAEAFAADSATRILLEEAVGTAEGMARLRDEVFDAVLVSHEAGELNALDLIEGYRAGGADEPILVLGTQSGQEMAALCYEVGADGYIDAPRRETSSGWWPGPSSAISSFARTNGSAGPSRPGSNGNTTKPAGCSMNRGPSSRSPTPSRATLPNGLLLPAPRPTCCSTFLPS